MRDEVQHSGLIAGSIEARGYQLEAVDEALSGSMLLVLPTAAGKTAVAWMVIAERLRTNSGGVIFLAPTNALVDQHLKSLEPVMKHIHDLNPISITGEITPKKRENLWESSRLIIATPHVVRNDVVKGILNLSNCCLLVVDEAHHATGNHPMAQAAELYNSQAKDGLILATTASPGSRTEVVEEICSRLDVERIHIRTSSDAMLNSYLAGLEVQELKVIVPDEIRELAEPLRLWLNGIIDRERRLGRYVLSGYPSYRGLTQAMGRAQEAIQRGESNAYSSVSNLSMAMRLNHLLNHLLSQGIAAAREFLSRMEKDGDTSKKSVKNFLRDKRIQSLKQSLDQMDEIHTKVGTVRRLVRARLRRDPMSKIIVFATFRDSVAAIELALEGLDGAKAIQFVGQSSRNGRTGLKPKEQIDRLNRFREGEFNVLVATSVAEEGLDIPSADLVIFYEPVPSEIRTIQRRGRTGRHREGEVVVLIAEDTKDEGAKIAAERKEENMQRAVQRVRRKLLRSTHIDLSNLDAFEVSNSEGQTSAKEFIMKVREESRPSIVETDRVEMKEKMTSVTKLPAQTFRPRGQTGLEQFETASNNSSQDDGNSDSSTQKIVNSPPPISISQDLSALEEIGPPDVPGAIITADDRELNSAVIARLRALGAEIKIERLTTGDYKIGERILVERKTVRDFVDSLVDGRLLEQASILVGAAPRTLILIEGEGLFQNPRVHPHALMGALTTLSLDFGIPVVTTKDGAETARFLTVASRREESMLDGLSGSAQDRLEAVKPEFWQDPVTQAAAGAREIRIKNDDERIAVRAMLESIPSIDSELSLQLLETFGTFANLVWAEEDDLKEIQGITEVQVRELLHMFGKKQTRQ